MRYLAPVLVLILAGCAAQVPAAKVRPVGVVTTKPVRPVKPAVLPKAIPKKKDLTPGVARYLKGRPGRAAVYVRDLRTGTTFGYHEHARFITASVMKVNILTGLLLQKKH